MPRSRSSRPSRITLVLVLLAVAAAVVVTQSPTLRARLLDRVASSAVQSSPTGVAPGFREAGAAKEPPVVLDSFMAACSLDGATDRDNVRALNRLKNRTAMPSPADVDTTVTLHAMLRPGDDTHRFDATRAATVEGWVAKVKSGGKETVNCGAGEEVDRDTHIELSADSGDADPTHHVIVEVTPRMRARMGAAWSTDSLRHALAGRRVRVTGWLFLDAEHLNASLNTRPAGEHDWRATAWELHPITGLKVVR